SADPRGLKVGGIETYTRDYLELHPDDIEILFVGPDEIGDLQPGRVNDVLFRGRRIGFLPLFRLDDSTNRYPDTIAGSETFRFARCLWRNRGLLRGVLRDGGYSAEVRRPEYAPILWWLGVPVFTMVHLWGDGTKPQSGILARRPWLRTATEFAAAAVSEKFYSVNPDYTARYAKRYRPFAARFDTLTTWANTRMFRPLPFRRDGPLRLVFAGRTDAFKRLDIMLAVVARLRAAGHAVEFHFVGDGDLAAVEGHGPVADCVVTHGRCDAAGVAGIIGGADIGLLTSEFEGMPRFAIECVASGRPVVALHLPQLEAMFATGHAGTLVARGPDQVAALAEAILALQARIRAGETAPETVAVAAESHRPERLLGRIWDAHRGLAARRSF
ncbi:MAG: glycosyltransferase, partial [Rhodobacteraceae bacterium]|nr:glycosyltransferase [Paracoccaceae bacterium]